MHSVLCVALIMQEGVGHRVHLLAVGAIELLEFGLVLLRFDHLKIDQHRIGSFLP